MWRPFYVAWTSRLPRLGTCLPPHQGTAPCHPRADCHHRDEIARLETARPVGLVERNRQRSTRRIAVTFEVQPTFFERNAEPLQHRFYNPGVGLMRDNVVDVADCQPVRCERFENRLRQHADRELIYLAPVHRDLVHVLGKYFGGLRMLAAAARYRQYSSGGSVGMKMRRQEAASGIARPADDHRARRIAEEHARVAIAPIDETAQELGADNEHPLGFAGLDELVGDAQHIKRARASSRAI